MLKGESFFFYEHEDTYKQNDWYATRVCAVDLLANILHYHDVNRHYVEVIPGALGLLLGLTHPDHQTSMREAALRCIVSLSATDRGARRIIDTYDEKGISACLALITAASDTNSGGALSRLRRYGTTALANLCAFTEARLQIQTVGGLEILVSAAACEDKETRNSATLALEALQEKIGQPERIKPRIRPSAGRLGAKSLVGLLRATPNDQATFQVATKENNMAKHFAAEKLVDAQNSAHAARKMGAESLEEGSEWLEPGNLSDFVAEGGIEALLANLLQYSDIQTYPDILTVTLEALYNCVHAHGEDHDLRQRISNVRGVQLLVSIARNASITSPKILEIALKALIPIATGYAPVCRTLLAVSLDFLLDIAENDSEPATDMPAVSYEHRELANILLRELAPHNLILCTNCSTKNRGGLVCVFCGHSLRIDDNDKEHTSLSPKSKKQRPITSAKQSLAGKKSTV